MKLYNFVLTLIFFSITLFSCQVKNTNTEAVDEETSNTIKISKEQFEFANMLIGNPLAYTFKNGVKAIGFVKVAPDGIEHVSVSIPGKATNIKYNEGQLVKKGDKLFNLQGDAVIQLQQDYAQNNAQFQLAMADLTRLKLLNEENIASKKEYQLALSNHQSLLAVNEGLKARLQLINIDPVKVQAGNMVSAIDINAQLSGYITERNLVNGQYIEPNQKTFEIMDMHKLKLYINVFEIDIEELQIGQKVFFYEPDRKGKVHEASLILIGKTIDQETKTITCTANINNVASSNFVDGMYTECQIVTEELNSMALPTNAIIKEGGDHYVLIKEKMVGDVIHFSKVQVEIGNEENDYTELLTSGLKDVLIDGAYNLIGVE